MSTPQRFCKTAKAWTLLAQPAGISRSVRALLLLANGQRSEAELSLLLGKPVSELAHRLRVQGYLQPVTLPSADDEDDIAVDLAWSTRGEPNRRLTALRASA